MPEVEVVAIWTMLLCSSIIKLEHQEKCSGFKIGEEGEVQHDWTDHSDATSYS